VKELSFYKNDLITIGHIHDPGPYEHHLFNDSKNDFFGIEPPGQTHRQPLADDAVCQEFSRVHGVPLSCPHAERWGYAQIKSHPHFFT
jgi:hypothetical protein